MHTDQAISNIRCQVEDTEFKIQGWALPTKIFYENQTLFKSLQDFYFKESFYGPGFQPVRRRLYFHGRSRSPLKMEFSVGWADLRVRPTAGAHMGAPLRGDFHGKTRGYIFIGSVSQMIVKVFMWTRAVF